MIFVRLFGYLFGIGSFLAIGVLLGVAGVLDHYTKDLPDYASLATYEPPVTTRVHAAGGELVTEYARERRLYLPIGAIPDLVKAAFLSAEDKNFYDHPGIDPEGLARAVLTNIKGGRMQGASTITQQVAKNFLLTNERTYERKIKEALLAFRIEQAYSKDHIFELYLNQIYLGMGSYGAAAAALNYFDKSVGELTVAEVAYLAALPKAPENYNPFRGKEKAIERRNWVIDRMVENGYLRLEDAEKAKAEPLEVKPRPREQFLFASEFFAEEVRRKVLELYGEDKLYGGGLSVRTSLDPELQKVGRRALQKGLLAYDQRHGFHGPLKTIDVSGDWGAALGAVTAIDVPSGRDGKVKEVPALADVPEWRLAVVLDATPKEAMIGLQPATLVSGKLDEARQTGVIPAEDMKWAIRGKGGIAGVLKPGDVVYVEASDEAARTWKLRQPPTVQGALVAMDPYTGRVKALVGGFSFAESEFNRATQAQRQPGSSFKPFVYAAALDNGYTPASVVMDGPLELPAGNGKVWRPQNYGGKFYGPSTLRTGIELSRNGMTVRLAKDMGMPLVAEYSKRFGIYDDLGPYLPMALGAGETTVMKMVTAYAIIANGGRSITPTLIDRVQDRYGRTVYKHDARVCRDCESSAWMGQAEPALEDNREQVLDPMTAFQITSMMEGVVTRGTATIIKQVVGKPIAGKTGTTNEEKDAWFVGFSPDLVVGVFVGFDQPKPMGKGMTGGQLAAPIFADFMKVALADQPAKEFAPPEGLEMIAINKRTGEKTEGSGAGVIIEAFKPGTEPSTGYSIIGYGETMGQPIQVSKEAEEAVAKGTGGLY